MLSYVGIADTGTDNKLSVPPSSMPTLDREKLKNIRLTPFRVAIHD